MRSRPSGCRSCGAFANRSKAAGHSRAVHELRGERRSRGAAGRTLSEETTGLNTALPRAAVRVRRRRPLAPTAGSVSIVYWALVQSEEAKRASVDENVQWFAADLLPALAFDHNLIVEYALWRLRNKMEYKPHRARLSRRETFTLAQLRAVHEAVLGRPLDPANFRRTIESSGCRLVPTATSRVDRHSTPATTVIGYDGSIDPPPTRDH